jgi:peptidoglycan/LPS O-acetylase OafA/YrhL
VPAALSDRSGVSLLGSYLLWPTNGGTFLPVGWTLVHEMYFYIVIAVMIALRLPVIWTLVGWAAVILLWPMPVTGQVGHVVFNPMTLLFIAGALFGVLTNLPDIRFRGGAWRVAVLLGDASYSTYLSHVFVVSAIWRLLPGPSALLIAASLIGANGIGVLSYWWLERPILKFTRARSLWLSPT